MQAVKKSKIKKIYINIYTKYLVGGVRNGGGLKLFERENSFN